MDRCYIITLRESTYGRGRAVGRSSVPSCRAKRSIQYAAAARFDHCCLWIWIAPPSRTMTTNRFAFSRRDSPELCFDFTLLNERGRREDRVHAAPAVSCASAQKKTHTSIQVQRRHPAFPAQWLYGLLRALPGERLSCHRRSARAASAELDASTAASGPHDFAVRDRPRSSVAAIASTASHRAFVTIASRPSCRVGRRINGLIWARTKGEYFSAKGWTTQITLIRQANLGSARSGFRRRRPATPNASFRGARASVRRATCRIDQRMALVSIRW